MEMNATAAFAVSDPSGVAAARRAALWLAERFAFDDVRAGRLAIVVTELATNLAKHARAGEILLRPGAGEHCGAPLPFVEVLAIDAGPGIPDVALSRRDGYSTSGTLGHGLGAFERQSDEFDLYTAASGTVARAAIYAADAPPQPRLPLYQVGAVHVSKPGEAICGDDWACRQRDGRLAILVADGLGHGLLAHEASRAATEVFCRVHEEGPRRVIEDVHGALRGFRGAAVAALAIDLERRVSRYCGLGNVSSAILHAAGTRQSLVSSNGTAGHTAPRVQEFLYPVPEGSVLVMHSDGLGTHWDLAKYPGLAARHPSVIAGVLYRDHARGRDDVTVVIAKERGDAQSFFT
jgi:anti-sigma regulatory factor (Ser/Thr protein kinase)